MKPGIYPGVDLSIQLGRYDRFYITVNRSMRLPTFTDLYYEGPQNLGNTDLLPETAITIESGYIISHPGWQGRVSGFYRNGKETIDWVWENDVWQAKNITTLNTYGGDAMLTVFPGRFLGFPVSPTTIGIAYGYTGISKDAGAFISNYALDNLRHKLVFDLHIDLWEMFYIDLKTSWQDRNGTFSFYETPDSTPEEMAYAPFWITDISVGAKHRAFHLFVNTRNLLNVEYRDIGSVVMPGRWISAGIAIK